MSGKREDFSDLLITHGIITTEQRAEARALAVKTGMRLTDALVKLGYTSPAAVCQAMAEFHRVRFIDLSEITIPPTVIELIPESVARENVVLPLAVVESCMIVVVSDPGDFDLVQKLQFILNKNIRVVLAKREQIIEALDFYYGPCETESVDSMLSEFTDTAIDFTETGDALSEDVEYELSLDACEVEALPQAPAPRPVARRATVRYYHRMNPERMFPLLVVLSKDEIQKVVKRGVSQGQSEAFRVNLGSVVEIEPVLPGCACYPPREQVEIKQGDATVNFWVVPHVLGRITGARVVVRQNGKTLAEVPLEACVARQRLAVACGVLSLLLPFVLMMLKQLRLDFESQVEDGFGLYAQLGSWLLHSLSPELLGGLLLVATGALYLWCRPRQRDVFWDVTPVPTAQPSEVEELREGEASPVPVAAGAALANVPRSDLIARAEQHFAAGNFREALRFYEGGLDLVFARPAVYHHAALAASHLGEHRRALAILRDAEARLDPAELSGGMLYNMGCCAARIGWFAQAIRYLRRAVDQGYTDPEKYRTDLDLAPLRWRPEFKHLVASLEATA
ncbi:MAG TPA: hypothetical protein VKD72_09770 [Gemmataceae bacterium]|nr:hypothetical protein [Gemmataceae bacterium]